MKIVISRTDSIGDVILTLPLASYLKANYSQDCEIIFLGRNYTKDIIESCPDIDQFISYDDNYIKQLEKLHVDCFIHVFPRKDIAASIKKLKVPVVIGTLNRLYHWGKCSKLVKFSRKKSSLHESQLNFYLLKPLLGKEMTIPSLEQIQTTLRFIPRASISSMAASKRVLFHPMSNGSAVDWTFDKFRLLGRELRDLGFEIGITGTQKEGLILRKEFKQEFDQSLFSDLTGQFNLKELTQYISESLALVASSTGPLHIAGVTGIHAVGLFSQVRPMHAGRWSPIGENIHIIEAQDFGAQPSIASIEVSEVKKVLDSLQSNK